jgi:hypothetical protein
MSSSPFLPPPSDRYRADLSVSDGFAELGSCLARGLHWQRFGFQDPDPGECLGRLRYVVKARLRD